MFLETGLTLLNQGRFEKIELYSRISSKGSDSSINMPGCVCWGSENVPTLKDALGKKTKNIPILKGSSTYFIPILWCNIKLKCIIPKVHSQSIIF